MADTKISAMTSAGALTGTEEVPVVQSGANVKTTVQDIADLASGGSGGIAHTVASGTDTYTATVTGVTSYADGDAYLVKFTNGNTDTSTLNINALGAKTLYRNNDGILIGGDIWAGAEMLCIFNSTLNGFQCIGTSPNSLFAYVVNADSVTINRGQPVFAFGSTGNRMSVKLANNQTDATSAQTYGLVYSTSIAAGQKGIIIIQGVLDGLNLGGTWNDGDPVYLGNTAGAITKTKPYAPNHLVYLGVVERANAGNGIMYVRVQNGYELDELHNVSAQTPANKDGLFYNTTTSLWESRQVSATDINANVSNTEFGYLDGVTSAIQTQFNSKEPSITTGTTAQYWRGDKSWQTLDKTAVGLGNVDNTSDATKNSATATLTNKRITARTGTVASTGTPSINIDNVDYYSITALATAITSVSYTGTPTIGQTIWISITDNGTARAIAWGSANWEPSGNVALPTTTVISTRLDVAFIWNEATSKWRCVGVA